MALIIQGENLIAAKVKNIVFNCLEIRIHLKLNVFIFIDFI